jgi:hypothetical protein
MLSTITIYNNEHNEGVQLLQEMLRSSWGQSKILDLTFSDYLAALRHPQVNKQYKLHGLGSEQELVNMIFTLKCSWNFLEDLLCKPRILLDCLHGRHCRHVRHGRCYTVTLIFNPHAIPLHTCSKLKHYHFYTIYNNFRDSSLTLLESLQLH